MGECIDPYYRFCIRAVILFTAKMSLCSHQPCPISDQCHKMPKIHVKNNVNINVKHFTKPNSWAVTLFTPKTAWCLHRNHRPVHINWRLRMTQWLATEPREIRRALLVDHTVYIVKQGGVLNTPKVAKSAQKRRKSLKIKDFYINLMGFCFSCFKANFAVAYNSVNDQ